MFILDVPPEQHREVPVLMAQVDNCAGDGCRNARPDPVVLLRCTTDTERYTTPA